MESNERLITSLQHKEPDRVPIDLGGTGVSTMCRGAYVDLMKYLGRDPEPIVIRSLAGQMVELDEAFLDEVVRADTRPVYARREDNWESLLVDDGDYLSYVNEWGVRLRMPKEDGHYFDMIEYPLQEPTKQALDLFQWPEVNDKAIWHSFVENVHSLNEKTSYGIVAELMWGAAIMEYSQSLRGMEAFLIDMLTEPKFADDLIGCVTEIMIAVVSNMLDEVGSYVHVVAMCDDLGIQNGPMMSPDTYRKRIKPLHARIIKAIKSRTDAYIFFHTCGASRAFFEDLIEIGVDIINPVQVSAKGMEDTADLKKIFGKDLTFWGGICDSQRILPFGTPQEVREETRRRLDDLMPGGGFVAAPIHNIQDGVPPENIMAMFETIHEYGVY